MYSFKTLSKDSSLASSSSSYSQADDLYSTPRSSNTIDVFTQEIDWKPITNIWSTNYKSLSIGQVEQYNQLNLLQPAQSQYVNQSKDNSKTPSSVSSPLLNSPLSLFPLKKPNYTFKNTNGNFFDVSLKSRFFVIKSYNINDVEASFQNGIWSSTDLGNKRLNKAFIELKSSSSTDKVLLFFLVNGSRKFCGVCEMIGQVDFNLSSNIWSETSRYKGVFSVNWLIIKDIPNKYFSHLLIPSNENKPVTNSRDTQEVPFDKAIAMLKIFSTFKQLELQ